MEKNRITILFEEEVDLKEMICVPESSFTFSINVPKRIAKKLIQYNPVTPLTPQKCLSADFIINSCFSS